MIRSKVSVDLGFRNAQPRARDKMYEVNQRLEKEIRS